MEELIHRDPTETRKHYTLQLQRSIKGITKPYFHMVL